MVASKVTDQPAGFLDQQGAGGHVPLGQTGFPEGVVATGGHVGQIEAGGAAAADTSGLAYQAAEHAQVVVQGFHLVLAERKAGAQQGAVQRLARADPQTLAVQ